MRKIGIMGGTFNPIHTGHLMLSEWAMDALGLSEVWLMPTGISYMKAGQKILSGQERLFMAELAAEGNSRLKCTDIELKRTGYTYTCETLQLLKEREPETEFYFILGADCLFMFDKWKEPEKILQNCKLTAAVREDSDLEEMKKKALEIQERFGGEVILLPFLRLSITSTEIRKRVRENKSIRYMVPEKVRAYIEEKGLYRYEENR